MSGRGKLKVVRWNEVRHFAARTDTAYEGLKAVAYSHHP